MDLRPRHRDAALVHDAPLHTGLGAQDDREAAHTLGGNEQGTDVRSVAGGADDQGALALGRDPDLESSLRPSCARSTKSILAPLKRC